MMTSNLVEQTQGIAKVADLYNENLVLMSFEELKSKYGIPAIFFF